MFGNNNLRLHMKVYIKKDNTVRNTLICLFIIFTLILISILGAIIGEQIKGLAGMIMTLSIIPITILCMAFPIILIIMTIADSKKHLSDFVDINDNLDFYVQNFKMNARFNLLERYRTGKTKIINYTYSNTIYISVKTNGYIIKLKGDTNTRNTLVPIFRSIGLKVRDVNDEPSDD